MCVVCGCGEENHDTENTSASRSQQNVLAITHPLHSSQPSVDNSEGSSRLIKLEMNILGANNKIATQNRAHFKSHGINAFNLMSSPGSGKTTLLCSTIKLLQEMVPKISISVIEGDQQTELDADRIRATGVSAFQVNTGKGCHLDAKMVANAYANLHTHEHHHHPHNHHHDHHPNHVHNHSEHIKSIEHVDHKNSQLHVQADHQHIDENDLKPSLLFVENVGNLVCPALWDLGELAKVVILSVTEGADKPLKYPDMFAASNLLIVNKIDLLAHVDFDLQACIEYAKRINPNIKVLELSAKTGVGMDLWIQWLLDEMQLNQVRKSDNFVSIRSIEDLERRRLTLESDLKKINDQIALINAVK